MMPSISFVNKYSVISLVRPKEMVIAIQPPIKTLAQDFTIGLLPKKEPIPPNANFEK